MSKWIDWITLGLYAPAIWISVKVVRHWAQRAFAVVKNLKQAEGEELLILGIFVSFLGITLNSSWWLLYYTVRWLSFHDFENIMLSYGFVVNMFTRQIPIMTAGFFHILAYHKYSTSSKKHPSADLKFSALIGFGYLMLVFGIDWLNGDAP